MERQASKKMAGKFEWSNSQKLHTSGIPIKKLDKI